MTISDVDDSPQHEWYDRHFIYRAIGENVFTRNSAADGPWTSVVSGAVPREMLRLAEESRLLREVRDLFAKGPDALERAVLARVRQELLAAIKDLPAGRLGHSPEAAHVLLAVRAAIDRICPEAGK